MKKTIGMLALVIALILAMTPFALAEGSVGVTVSAPASASTGDTITYVLNSTGISGSFVNYTVALNYDSANLSYVSSNASSIPSGWTSFSADNGSRVTFLISDESTVNPSSEGFSISITFAVVGEATADTAINASATVSGALVTENGYSNVNGSGATATVTLLAPQATTAPTQSPSATSNPTQAPSATAAPTQAPGNNSSDTSVPKTGDMQGSITLIVVLAMIVAAGTLLRNKLVRKG